MKHQMIILGQRADLTKFLIVGVDGSRTGWLAPTREGAIETINGDLPDDGRALMPLNILSIDARRFDDGWTWNAWYKRGTLALREFRKLKTPRQQLRYMREEGYLASDSQGKVRAVDDGYNVEFQDRFTGEPLFAIEYGPAYD